ncbi:mutator type transposase [Tanacetum coccineum]
MHTIFVDTDNQLVDVEVDMDHFDTANAKTMGNDRTPEFNANEVFDIGIDVIDTEEFESASDEDGIERIRKFSNSVVVKDLVHRHSIETRKELYLKKNDKVRVRVACRGTIPVFNTSCDIGSSNVVESSQTQREVDMDHFDTANAKTMGNDRTPEFNANEVFDTGIDVIDTEEFESASDEDRIERIRSRKKIQLKKQNNFKEGGLQKVHFFVGQEFSNSAVVKDLVHRHSIETRRELYLKKNDKVRVRVACRGTIHVFNTSCDIGPSNVVESSQTQRGESSQPTKWTKGKIVNSKGVESLLNMSKKVGGKPSLRKVAANQCPWVLQVSKLQDSETWQVKTFDDTHKCLQSRKIKYCTADFFSKDSIDQIETNPEIPVKAFQEQLQRKFQLGVFRIKAFKAKAKAIDNVRAKEGFKACMRQFLGFDGTLMKGPFLGQRLTAVGVDPNNGIYPLAYGIVETKSMKSWTWFLQHLKEDLDLQDNSNFAFISDRQKVLFHKHQGIIPAIAELFPAAEHRFCLRHIHENMKLKWIGAAYKELLWKVVTALTVPYFEKVMDELKAFNKECYDWLAKIPPNHWARSHFSGRAKNDILLNNICEVFNSQLVDGRDRPIISTLEYAREYLMKSIVNVKQVIKRSDGSTSNAGKKRPRSETTTGISQAAKKPNNVVVGVQTRSKATNKGNQPTTAAKKHGNKAKKKV